MLSATASGEISPRNALIYGLVLTVAAVLILGIGANWFAAGLAALGSFYSGSPWIGVLAGIGGGLLAALLHAVATIRYRADQVVVGIAMNLLAVGVTRFFLRLAFDSSSNSPRVPGFGGSEATSSALNTNSAGMPFCECW